MKVQNEALGVAFELPDDPTYLTVLAYDEIAELTKDKGFFERLWMAAKQVISGWECENLALSEDDLNGRAGKAGIEIIKYVCITAWNWRQGLDEIPKN